MEQRKHIVILGAGFGGITLILKLYRKLKQHSLLDRYQIVLVDRNFYHLYTPALYEIASIPKGEASAVCLKPSICIAIEDIIGKRNIRFIQDEIICRDKKQRAVMLRDSGKLPYEYLVFALGTETNYYGIPGLKEHALPLKTFENALLLRNKIESLVTKSDGMVKIVIGGAGATGVELAAEFENFICALREKLTGQKTCDVKVILIEAAGEILQGFSKNVIRGARRRLEKIGVTILTHSPIAEVKDKEIVFKDGSRMNYDCLIFAGGVKPPSLLSRCDLLLDHKGGINVNKYLEAEPKIFAIGDNAAFAHSETGKPLPWNVPVAETEARIAAKNIIADILGKQKRAFRPLKKYPFILAVGKKYAIADMVFFTFSGFLGWLAKQIVELRYFLFILPFPKAIRTWLYAMRYITKND